MRLLKVLPLWEGGRGAPVGCRLWQVTQVIFHLLPSSHARQPPLDVYRSIEQVPPSEDASTQCCAGKSAKKHTLTIDHHDRVTHRQRRSCIGDWLSSLLWSADGVGRTVRPQREGPPMPSQVTAREPGVRVCVWRHPGQCSSLSWAGSSAWGAVRCPVKRAPLDLFAHAVPCK
jgi:hypothetical protein